MQVSEKDISVFPELCASQQCSEPNSCDVQECALCKHCLSDDELIFLKEAYLEHVNRHSTKRVYPKPLSKDEAIELKKHNSELSDNNAKMHQWFVGKCLMDELWCH